MIGRRWATRWFLAGVIAAVVLVQGCAGEPTAPPAERPPEQAAGAKLTTPRISSDERAVHARAEMAACAEELLRELAASSPGGPVRVAVYRFTRRGREDQVGEWLASTLTTAMVRGAAGRCEVYTRRKLSRVLEEWKFQATGLVDPDTLRKAGKLSGVDGVLAGVIDQDATTLRLTCEVVGVETGEVMASARVVLSLAPLETAEPVGGREQAIASLGDQLAQGLADGLVLACYDVTRGTDPWVDVGADLMRGVKGRLDDSPHLQAYDRDHIATVLQEKKLQATLGDEQGQAQAAKFVGAKAIVAGFGAVFEQHCEADLFVIDVESARVLSAAHALFRRERARRR